MARGFLFGCIQIQNYRETPATSPLVAQHAPPRELNQRLRVPLDFFPKPIQKAFICRSATPSTLFPSTLSARRDRTFRDCCRVEAFRSCSLFQADAREKAPPRGYKSRCLPRDPLLTLSQAGRGRFACFSSEREIPRITKNGTPYLSTLAIQSETFAEASFSAAARRTPN